MTAGENLERLRRDLLRSLKEGRVPKTEWRPRADGRGRGYADYRISDAPSDLLEEWALYLAGLAGQPGFLAPANEKVTGNKRLVFTLSDPLYLKLLEEGLDTFLGRSIRAATKYGYRGFSRGGQNGVFRLRPSDEPLLRALEKLKQKHEMELANDLELQTADEFDDLLPVKIVCHNDAGERYVGLARLDIRVRQMEKVDHRAVFLGLGKY